MGHAAKRSRRASSITDAPGALEDRTTNQSRTRGEVLNSTATSHAGCRGRWGEWRSGIKEGEVALGHDGGTAAEPFTPASTAHENRTQSDPDPNSLVNPEVPLSRQ